MFTLAIRYLNGWAMAAVDGARKERPEWPPHPDRIFMALAAAWFETDQDPAEGEALRWLEALEPPAIAASDAEPRRTVRSNRPAASYVPVNDARMGRSPPRSNDLDKLKDAGLAMLPAYRSRQPRAFPVAIPHEPLVYLVWPTAEPGSHLQPLGNLARKVTHVGHSASLVQAWVETGEIEPTWIPVSGVAKHRLRVPGKGRLRYLEERCNREAVVTYAELTAQADALKGKEKKQMKEAIAERFGDRAPVSLRPEPGLWQGYARHTPTSGQDAPGTVFDSQLIAFALSGKRHTLQSTLKLTHAMRGALMAGCPVQPPPEWFSGHTSDGAPTKKPHLALLPLPFVGSAHADGRVMGLGIALPHGLDPAEAGHCLAPFFHEGGTGLPASTRLFDGKWIECAIELDTRESPPVSLRTAAWVAPSRVWASVTPVAFDHHFNGKDKWERAAEALKDACERIGLPRPQEVRLHPVSLVEGVPHARDFPRLTRKSDGGQRHHSHAVIVFEESVRGPVLIGAGRFRGYGLCRPMRSDNHDD